MPLGGESWDSGQGITTDQSGLNISGDGFWRQRGWSERNQAGSGKKNEACWASLHCSAETDSGKFQSLPGKTGNGDVWTRPRSTQPSQRISHPPSQHQQKEDCQLSQGIFIHQHFCLQRLESKASSNYWLMNYLCSGCFRLTWNLQLICG